MTEPVPPREEWHVIPLNPEPWAIGTLGLGRNKGGVYPTLSPNLQVVAFQEAVREHFYGQTIAPFEGDVELRFFYWRQLSEYESMSTGRRVAKKPADATNMQKSLEDALQEIFYANDRVVRRITSEIKEQSPETEPKIVICVREYVPPVDEIPPFVWDQVANTPTLFDGQDEFRPAQEIREVF